MNKIVIFVLMVMPLITQASRTEKDVVYGEDYRIETIDSPSVLYQRLARSTAALVHRNKIQSSEGVITLTGENLSELVRSLYKRELCHDERFYDQPAVSNCSGVLIAPDVIASAGHCYMGNECTDFLWVFNYKIQADSNINIKPADIYKCKEVIKQGLSGSVDFALIRLDRKVVGVKPITINTNVVEVGTPLVLIGHPSGLPQKIADGAEVKSVSQGRFKSNLDAFRGNSGSPVFHAVTGQILGILSGGEEDYIHDQRRGCLTVNVLSDEKGNEGVSSASQFIPYLFRSNTPLRTQRLRKGVLDHSIVTNKF